jgi:2,3-bisphosphoglycerate-independent phosphoglycerate mutase
MCGLTVPVGPGITAGSGPGHLALFGYDPIEHEIGRGALEALGVDFELGAEDVAARGNFCTVDQDGRVVDRRAGRLATEESRELLALLRTIRVERAEFFLEPVKEHRFAFVLRAPGLGDRLSDSDPLQCGVPTLPVVALDRGSQKAASLINCFLEQAANLLAGQRPANGITLRGFARLPALPTFGELYGLRAASIAIQGMYRGVSKLAGMTLLDTAGLTVADEFTTLEKHWPEFDFFYLHVKKTDTCGENGDFEGKVRAIEEVDRQVPRLLALAPDVVVVAGDHSSPAVMKAHSWHPVPVLVYSKNARPDCLPKFGERACAGGSLGVFPARQLMSLMLANAGRLAKYGA